MPTKQHGGPKDAQRDIHRKDIADDERRHQVKTPDKGGEHPPGMGEDEDKDYVPEKQRP
jgi:hypothetical protein